MVVSEALKMGLAGLLLGLAGDFAATRLLEHDAVGRDPESFDWRMIHAGSSLSDVVGITNEFISPQRTRRAQRKTL